MHKMFQVMIKKFRGKIVSQHGETMAETLVAALIAALGLLLLASMIMSATRIVELGEARMNSFYAGVSAMEAKSGTEEIRQLIVVGEHGKSGMNETLNVTVYEDEENGLFSYQIQ